MMLRLAAMTVGTAVTVAAMAPVTEVDGSRPLTVHMVELVAIVFVAAPLLAVPAPLRRGRWGWRSMAAAFAAMTAGQWLVHVPAVLAAELRSGALHGCVQAGLLVVAVVYWSVPAAWTQPSPFVPIIYLVAAMPAGDALSIWLMSTSQPLYQGVTLADQRAAGAAMLVGSIVLGLSAVAVGWRAVRDEHAAQLRAEGMPAAHG